ncbi:sce7726 family protein [Acinetobacter junii]|uniref:sce7726 family protein n=1 Tax=Acinetobacter junii TaxID=40215 RepID=UPI00124DF7B7|nr:sce7726 family protein [Acinetobacter junii]MDH1858866.1 sce7726 family protein [Acinetobacter junii]
MAINKMLDRDVRQAVKNKVLKDHINDPSTLVIDELGLNYGRNRVDIAVINGEIHGYELKSDSDNLIRLPQQAECYSLVMDKVTLVVGEKHYKDAIPLVPEWWGIKIAIMGKNGAVHLTTERKNKKNRNIDPHELLKLIWKDEVMNLLSLKIDIDWRIRKLRKKDIYQLVVDNFTLDEIRANTRTILKSRLDWRFDL